MRCNLIPERKPLGKSLALGNFREPPVTEGFGGQQQIELPRDKAAPLRTLGGRYRCGILFEDEDNDENDYE